jgi:hypothetical protein
VPRALRILAAPVVAAVLVGLAYLAGAFGADAVPPAALVGTWRGGAPARYYAFAADGGYRSWSERDPAALNTGTVTVDGDVLTFSNGGAPVEARWSVAGTVLFLDGQAYTRVDPPT